jgi:aminopeptidase S
VAGIVCAAAVTACSTTPPAPAPDSRSAHDSALVEQVSGRDATIHLAALQRIADDNGGNRAAPGPGYEASVDYVVRMLRQYGYQVSTPRYPVYRHRGPMLRDVVAQTSTGSQDHVVMLGAHLDSVENGPGINDNGTGVAALLEIAAKLGPSPSMRNAVRFAFWGSEEDDMQGSTHYVETLSDQQRADIQVYLNLDMLASPNVGYFVLTNDDAATQGAIVDQQLAAEGVRAENIDYDDGSDFVPFVDAGIPSVGIQAGDEQTKTRDEAATWGGTAGQVFDRCYHSACDRLSNVDAVAFDRYTNAVAGTVEYLATH